MKCSRPLVFVFVLSCVVVFRAWSSIAAETSGSTTRFFVSVAPQDIGARLHDESPAELVLRASDLKPDSVIDLSSLRIVRVDPRSGKSLSEPLPFRWYDDSIPYDFPECEQNLHSMDGLNLQFINRPRWGDFYNVVGDGIGGRLVWTHRQEGQTESVYAVTCKLLKKGTPQPDIPPRGLVGDGSHRCRPSGSSSTGMIHSRVAIADWNDDGLPDLLVGGATGHVLCYANSGTKTKPDFPSAKIILTADGKPLDVGWSAAPLATDWNGDGVTDLLCGGERNRILYYLNTGTNQAPRLVNQGFLQADGQPIVLPTKPVPKAHDGVFVLDYYPILDVVDWNGDGRRDLLAGGFVTGRVFLFENTATTSRSRPELTFRGPLSEGDHPLNVHDWAASPCAVDIDDDGDFDLITGSMPMTDGGGDSSDAAHFVRYFRNEGSATAPKLVERSFPKTGEFPNGTISTPRVADLNGDGVLDLVVSSGENIYLYDNVGTRKEPKFAVGKTPLKSRWGSAALPTFAIQFLDWDGDGLQDIFYGLNVYCRRSDGEFRAEPLLPSGTHIDHPAPHGDGWIFTQLADLDGEGRLDLLYGSHEGHIWFHRRTADRPAAFEEHGVQLETVDGKPLHVGPIPGDKLDFDVLQGSRTAFTTADFDADGLVDLVVGDTYGKVRHFRNVGTAQVPRFALPVEIGDLKIRMVPAAADWDGDGRIDVVGSSAGGPVVLYRNLGDRFAAASPIEVPTVPYSPSAVVADWNQDGDSDLVVGTAYGYFCWFDRSFLDRGYAKAKRTTAPTAAQPE